MRIYLNELKIHVLKVFFKTCTQGRKLNIKHGFQKIIFCINSHHDGIIIILSYKDEIIRNPKNFD